MAVTRLERKGQKNKARARVRKQMMKVQGERTQVASPYKEESGVVLEGFDIEHFIKTGEVKTSAVEKAEAPVAEETSEETAAETATEETDASSEETTSEEEDNKTE